MLVWFYQVAREKPVPVAGGNGLDTTQIYAQVGIRVLKTIPMAVHPGRMPEAGTKSVEEPGPCSRPWRERPRKWNELEMINVIQVPNNHKSLDNPQEPPHLSGTPIEVQSIDPSAPLRGGDFM